MAAVPRKHMLMEEVQWTLSVETIYKGESCLRVRHRILIAVAQLGELLGRRLIRPFQSKDKENQLASSMYDAALLCLTFRLLLK